MSDPFKNPLSPKERRTSRNYAAPTKEQATTGRWMNAGDDYGLGHRTPVGTEKVSGMSSGPIPQKSKCMNPDMLNIKD